MEKPVRSRRRFSARVSGQLGIEHKPHSTAEKRLTDSPSVMDTSGMDKGIGRRSWRTIGISWRGVLSPSWPDKPHAITITDFAAACAALDYGYAAWFSPQIDEVIARRKGQPD